MRAAEVRGLGTLAGRAAGAGTRGVAEVHRAVAGRVFAGVARGVGQAADPVRLLHDGIAGATYAAVRGTLTVGGRLAGIAAAGWATPDHSLADGPRGRHLLAALNAVHGDLLDRELAALALPMSLRLSGRDLAAEPAALAVGYPAAAGRLAVFLPGLGETEDAWRYRAGRRHGDPTASYGTLLQRDLGYAPVWVRYNTGLHISANGRQLAALLDRLVRGWPVPVTEVVLVGHSMGGLVIRSALAQAGGQPVGQAAGAGWPGLVRATVTLGSPHLGAPLERAANVATHLLRRLPETRPLAGVLAARSAGIKDMRYGNLLDADWAGHDPDALLRDTRADVPLHSGGRHFAVLATLVGPAEGWAGELLGDAMVPPRSACGDTGDARRLPFPVGHVHRLPGLHHLDLLNHPAVYVRLHAWLTDLPAPGSG